MNDFNINSLIVRKIYDLIASGTKEDEIVQAIEELCQKYDSPFDREEVVSVVAYAASNISPRKSKSTDIPETLIVNTKGGSSERINRF